MIHTLILHQYTDPIYKPEREPECPECHSQQIKQWYDPETKETKGICLVCDLEDWIDKFYK